MKRIFYFLLMFATVSGFASCESDTQGGAPTITSVEVGSTTAVLGDEISFSVAVQPGGEALSSVRAQAYFGEELLSETFFPTGAAGTLSGQLYIPYRPNLADGAVVTLRFVAKDRLFNFSSQTKDITVSYPTIASLTLVTATGEYPASAQPDGSYKVNDPFPAKVKGFIDLVTSTGRNFRFGLTNGVIAEAGSDSIVFQGENPSEPFEIVFNPRTFFAAPMSDYVDLSFGGADSKIITVEQGQAIAVDISLIGYWINPTFFTKNADDRLMFKAMTGLYRITNDATLKYLKVEPMNAAGTAVAEYNPATGEGAVWINGNNQVGIPSYATNNCNWAAAKSFAMAPMGNKIYKLYIDGTILNYTNINFKFFGTTGLHEDFNKPDETIVAQTDIFRVDTSSGNVGNIRAGATPPESGKAYWLTLDCSTAPAILTAEVDE